MKSYLTILVEQAQDMGLPLLQAFKEADIPTSTYYRAVNGVTELRHQTAVKVMNAIEKLYALQQARQYTKSLRATGQTVNRRTIRAKFKPRSVGG
jgi:predicted transcriptional regulator